MSILFVCLGNICRSPLAEAVFRAVVEKRGQGGRFRLDSAGTGDWHVGKRPDRRAVAVGRANGLDMSGLRARQVAVSDFVDFDLILGMDDENVDDLAAMAPPGSRARIAQFHAFATGESRPVPDPYFGGDDGFDETYRLIRAASEELAAKLADEPRTDNG